MKSYTGIEQSKKLAEFLPLESADMYYFLDPTPVGNIYHIVIPQIDFGVRTREPEYNEGDIPCWSASALLEVIRNNGRYELQMYEGGYYFEANGFMTESYFNPIDACVEMILKLKENKLL